MQQDASCQSLDANARSEIIHTDATRGCTKKFNYSYVLAYDRPGASQVLAPYVDCGPGWQNLPSPGAGQRVRELQKLLE